MDTRDNLHTAIAREVPAHTPQCVGIIMDGNRRWARRHGYPATHGHHVGYDKLRSVMQWTMQEGIAYLIVYAFSTENQKRSQEEVDVLMGLFRTFFKTMLQHARTNDVKLSFIGAREKLPCDIQTGIRRLEEQTSDCAGLEVVFAAPYGARAEIVDAMNRIKDTESTDEPVTEDTVRQYLWTAELPDPDMIIRTGGRTRLSNFLLWQAAYSELFFTGTLWPDFTQREFTKMLYDFSLRQRTHGK